MKKVFSLGQIVSKALNMEMNEDIIIDGLNFCNRNTERMSILSFATHIDYVESVKNNPAIAALIVTHADLPEFRQKLLDRKIVFIANDNPEWAFYDIHDYIADNTDFYNLNDSSIPSKVGIDCHIHPSVIIEDGVIIKDNVTINANSVICKGSVISNGSIIGYNTVISSEGFQIIRKENTSRHIRHYGGVFIGENVYIGDNSCICRSLFEGQTIIGDNAKIDNLIHIAHNCYVGCNAVLTAGTILCGSSIIAEGAWVGVNSSVLNNVIVGKNARIGIGSVVTRDIEPARLAYGVPAKMK